MSVTLILSVMAAVSEAVVFRSDEAAVVTLERELKRHSNLYETGMEPELTDIEYDRLEEYWRNMRGRQNDQESLLDVGVVGEGIAKGTHFAPMLSLRKEKAPEDIEAAFKRLGVRFGWDSAVGLLIEAKLDGVAVNLVYKDGLFVRALSRGDGAVGGDWTQKVLAIGGIPMKLVGTRGGGDMAGILELRGEITIGRKAFAALAEQSEAVESEARGTPRSYAASSLQMEDLDVLSERNLAITIFAIGHSSLEKKDWTRVAFREQLIDWGFRVPEAVFVEAIDGVSGTIRRFWESVKDGDDPLDGLVIKLDSFAHWEAVGQSSEGPVGAIAWKPRGPIAVTRVTGIQWEPSRFGTLIPVANLEPVKMAGRVVQRVHLHNRSIQSSLRIEPGCELEIELAGDVIPVISRVLSDASEKANESAPGACPRCGGELEYAEPHLRCMSPACPGIQLARLCWFAEKMRIKGLGETTLRRLVEAGLVAGPCSLYELAGREEALAAVIGVDAAVRLARSVKASKSADLARWIEAIGIEGVGKAQALELERRVANLGQLEDFLAEEAGAHAGVSGSVSSSVMRGIRAYLKDVDRRTEWHCLSHVQSEGLSEKPLRMP